MWRYGIVAIAACGSPQDVSSVSGGQHRLAQCLDPSSAEFIGMDDDTVSFRIECRGRPASGLAVCIRSGAIDPRLAHWSLDCKHTGDDGVVRFDAHKVVKDPYSGNDQWVDLVAGDEDPRVQFALQDNLRRRALEARAAEQERRQANAAQQASTGHAVPRPPPADEIRREQVEYAQQLEHQQREQERWDDQRQPEQTEPQHDVQQAGRQQDREQQVRHEKRDADAEPLTAADCQAKLDADDFAAVAPCVDQVSGQGYGSKVRSCLDSVAVALKDVAACPSEKNEDCVARALGPLVVTENSLGNSIGKRRRSCGYLDISGYEGRHLAALHVDATLARLEADAAAQLAKTNARESACRLAGVIAYAQKGSATLRDVEHKTGKINYAARREISETLQVADPMYRQALVDFRRTWKRSFNRASDCQSWTGTTCKMDGGTGATLCDVSPWAP